MTAVSRKKGYAAMHANIVSRLGNWPRQPYGGNLKSLNQFASTSASAYINMALEGVN